MASQSARLITAPMRSQAGYAAGPLCAHFIANFWDTINRDPGSVASAAVVAEAQSRSSSHRSRILRAVLAGAAGIALIAFVAAIQPEHQLSNATGIKLTAEQATSPAEGRGPVAIDVDDTDANNQMQNLLNQASTLLSGSGIPSADNDQDLLDQASQQQRENEQQDELNQQQSEQNEDQANQATQQAIAEEDQSLMQLDQQDAGEQ